MSLVFGHDPHFDVRVLIKVEGDDGGDVRLGLMTKRNGNCFRKYGASPGKGVIRAAERPELGGQ